MKYLLMLMLHNDNTLVTRNNMLKKPSTVQEDSENGHLPATTADTVSGMLIAETNKSAADRPRINILVIVLNSFDLQITIHKEILPINATATITHMMKASNPVVGSIKLVGIPSQAMQIYI